MTNIVTPSISSIEGNIRIVSDVRFALVVVVVVAVVVVIVRDVDDDDVDGGNLSGRDDDGDVIPADGGDRIEPESAPVG